MISNIEPGMLEEAPHLHCIACDYLERWAARMQVEPRFLETGRE